MYNLENIQELLSNPQQMLEIKDVKINKYFSFILYNNGDLFVCGDNKDGILGNENKNKVSNFIKVKDIPLISKIDCGDNFIIALDKSNCLWGWGNSCKGQFGLGTDKIVYKPYEIDIKGNKIIDIAAGKDFSFYVTDKGKVFSSGNNYYGQLGLGHNNNISEYTLVSDMCFIEKVSCGENHVCLLSKYKKVFTCGLNKDGQLGVYDLINKNTFCEIEKVFNVKEINTGKNHSTILREDGYLLTCGNNDKGQLGLGDTISRNLFVKIKNLTDVKDFKINLDYSMAMKKSGEVLSWGYNDFMKLSLNENKFITKPTSLNLNTFYN